MMDEIIQILDAKGPLTGKELLETAKSDELSLWRYCFGSSKIITKTIGKPYLRLDRQVEGYARLSPSIMREFYSYTVIGIEKHISGIFEKANSLHREIIEISKRKFTLAYEIISKLVESLQNSAIIKSYACFIIAGDVVYEMSHSESRPEPSTGELVKGSDLDIVVVTENLSHSIVKSLHDTIYKVKYQVLKNPSYREEHDYIIKDISKIKKQLRFDTFESMVASKVLFEGKFLFGNSDMFKKIKKMLQERDIHSRMSSLEKIATINRNKAIHYLLGNSAPLCREDYMKLFYTKEEKEEFY
jgi:hypothetical protein